MAESARILIAALGVCLFCTGLLVVALAALWSRLRALEARLDRYRADQRIDRARLDDLEPLRTQELQRQARRIEHERAVAGRPH